MLEIRNKEFYLRDKKINIYSGAMHYFRVLPEYWEDRLTKMKLAGLNTVETYVAWNVHEPKEGEFCFEGRYDLVKFLKTAQKVGLNAIVRPGPYICAEWDFGGFPSWLLADERIKLRCSEPIFISKVEKYFKVLLEKLVPQQMANGGNIIAFQIENEYGSYGRDKKYLEYLKQLYLDCGVVEMLFTSDGDWKYHLSGGGLPEVFQVANFGSFPKHGFRILKNYQPNKPLMCGEYWCGWFDHYGDKHLKKRPPTFVAKTLNEIFEMDANLNFYMFHGGTNFGFTSGANFAGCYQPTTTSYDYDAPLNEYGDYTPKYHTIRELLCKKQGIELSPLPPSPSTQSIGKVCLNKTAGLMENLERIGYKKHDNLPRYMEFYGQAGGLILYRTEIKGDYDAEKMTALGVHDIAYAYVNGKKVARFDRRGTKAKLFKKAPTAFDKKYPENFRFQLPAFDKQCKVDILVEGMGRVNFDKQLYDRKGLDGVMIGEQFVYDWDIYNLPLDNLEKLEFNNSQCEYPKFLKGEFSASSKADCFVDMKGFTKGVVFINGFNLGRYWNIGPQQTLYLPGVLLKDRNEIVILELENATTNEIEIVDKPIFGKF